MIRTDGIKFKYEKSDRELDFPDITLVQNESLLILGKSGIGKTTLLHILGGILAPDKGDVTINETPIHRMSPKALDRFRGRNIGMVFQNNHAIRSLNVTENLKARLVLAGKTASSSEITNVLVKLGLKDLGSRKVTALSEGQLQRLGIAMAVIHGPKLILADEPTSSLDDENCKLVMNLLIEQAQNYNANLIVITHDQRVKSLFANTMSL